MVTLEVGVQFRRVGGRILVEMLCRSQKKGVEKKWNILFPFTERRNMDPVGAQAIVEVISERSRRNQRLEVAVCGQDNAGIASLGNIRAERVILDFRLL